MRRQIPILLSCFALTCLWSAPEASAQETLTGKLVFKDLPANLDNVGGAGFNWRIPVLPQASRVKLPLEEMLVVLVHSKRHRKVAEKTIVVEGYQIKPTTMVVPPGTELTIKNKGSVDVTLKALGRSSIAPIELTEDGEDGLLSLDKPGRYLFRATDYTSVLSYVIVTQSVADSDLTNTGPGEAGFDLGKVSAGSYELRVYFRGVPILKKDLKVTSEGKASEDQFLLTREDFSKILPRL